MAATYPATNLQLQYNSDNDEWSFNEVAYDYPTGQVPSWQGYTTPDIPFPEDDDGGGGNGDDDRDPCPPGYIYDDSLKQCIPDANYQAPSYAGEPGDDDRRDEPEFLEFDASTPEGRKAMYEHGLEHGYFTDDTSRGGAYEFLGAPKTEMPLWGVKWLAQFGEDSEYNRYINELAREDAKRKAAGQSPILAQAVGFFGLAESFKNWGSYAMNVASNIRTDTTTGFQRTTPQDVEAPSADVFNQRGLGAADVSSYRTFEDQEAELEQERKQEIHEERVNQEKIKTERAQFDLEKSEREDYGKEKAAQQERVRQRQEEKEAGTGGSFGREERPVIQSPKSRFSPAGGPRPHG